MSPHNNVISFQICPRQGGQALGKEMPGLHASAVRLPGQGQTGFTGVVRRAPGEGRQRQSPVAVDKKIKSKRVVGHPFIQQILITHLLGAKLCSGGGWGIREGICPSLGPPGELTEERTSS